MATFSCIKTGKVFVSSTNELLVTKVGDEPEIDMESNKYLALIRDGYIKAKPCNDTVNSFTSKKDEGSTTPKAKVVHTPKKVSRVKEKS